MKTAYALLLCTSLSCLVCFAQSSPESLNELMNQWLKLESQKGALQNEWLSRRQQIQEKLKLFEIERSALQQVIDDSKMEKNEVESRRLELLKKQDELEQQQSLMDAQLQQVTSNMEALVRRIPPPLHSEWQEKLSLLEQENVSNSEKLERLLSLFKSADEFDGRVALHRDAMTIPGTDNETQNVLVNQIYVGMGHGWYVSDDGSSYGYGRAEPLGWRWWHGEEASEFLGINLEPNALLQVLTVLQNPTKASYLPLPIKLQ